MAQGRERTKEQLYREAKRLGVKGRSKMNKGQLKAAVEEAAGREGRSVNAWLVRAASTALRASERDQGSDLRGRPGAQHYTGWAR